MSTVQRTYRIWNGCGWDRVTTSEAVWRATPRYLGTVALATGCGVGVIGAGITLAWPKASGDRWPIVHGAPSLRGQEAGMVPVSYIVPPNSGAPVQCPEPPALALFGLALLLILAVRMVRHAA